MSGRNGLSFTVEGFDGSKAWSMTQDEIDGDADLQPADRKRILQNAQSPVSALWNAHARGDTIELIEGRDGGGAGELALRVLRKDEPDVTIYLDSKTYLERRWEGTKFTAGVAHDAVTDLSDYRSVDGFKIPFLVKTRPKQSDDVTTIRWATCKVNVELPDQYFATPIDRPINKP